jgi:hypothetical protein
MQAIGSLVVPVLRYCFGIINWHIEKIYKLDRKTRKILTVYGQYHLRADGDRLYVPRKVGRRGLTHIEVAYITEATKLAEYIEGSEDLLLQVVRTYQHNANALLPRSTQAQKEHERKLGKEKDTRTVSAQSRQHAGGWGTDLPMAENGRY